MQPQYALRSIIIIIISAFKYKNAGILVRIGTDNTCILVVLATGLLIILVHNDIWHRSAQILAIAFCNPPNKVPSSVCHSACLWLWLMCTKLDNQDTLFGCTSSHNVIIQNVWILLRTSQSIQNLCKMFSVISLYHPPTVCFMPV